MRTVACEGRTFVMTANQCQRYKDLPEWVGEGRKAEGRDGEVDGEDWASRGGSAIVGPDGTVLTGPSWETEEDLLVVNVDLDDCLRGRLDFDAAGSYSRMDAFKLSVEGLDLDPPV